MRLAWAAAAIALSGCVADVGAGEAAIVNGTLEPGRPAVVFMYRLDGSACTGTIISPRVVLTANHCVDGAPASYFRIYVGGSRRSFTAEYRVREVRQLPSGGFGSGEDLALLILSAPARETPMEIARESPSRLWGASVTAVGYGETPAGGSGTKYTTTTIVEGLQGGFILVEPAVCSGDSGGPLIGPDGLIYGVASFIYSPDGMTEPRCGTAPGAYNEIYRHLDFIDAALEETGTCVPDGEEVCNGEDDDCDELVDEGCLELGEACTSGAECFGGVCEDTAAGRLCTAGCDPLRPGEGCGPGFYCAASGCEGHCVPGAEGAMPHGAECASNTDCASLFCIDPGDGMRRCLDPCRGDAGLCLAGEVCAAPPGRCGGCVAREILRGERGLGEPCERDEECRGAMVCNESGGVSECASSCSAESPCGDGFECRAALCVRDRRQGVGGICLEQADCPEAVCATQGDRQWCTVQCTAAEDCPRGFECAAAGGGTMVCAPALALEGEECAGNEDCASGLCAISGEAGACTSLCGGHDACAPGLECRRTGDGRTAACVPIPRPVEPRGGCSAAGAGRGGAPTGLLLLLLGLSLLARRRR